MYTGNKTTKKIIKFLSLVLTLAILTLDVSWAYPDSITQKSTLSAWLGTCTPSTNRKMLAKMYERHRLTFVPRSESFYGEVLKRFHTQAYLCASGRYALSEELEGYATDDEKTLKFVRAITYQDFRILMRRLGRDDPKTYYALRKRVLNNDEIVLAYYNQLPYSQRPVMPVKSSVPLRRLLAIDIFKGYELQAQNTPYDQAESILFDNIMAKAFETRVMIDETFANATEINQEEIFFANLVRTLQRRTGYALPSVFFNTGERLQDVLKLQEELQLHPGVEYLAGREVAYYSAISPGRHTTSFYFQSGLNHKPALAGYASGWHITNDVHAVEVDGLKAIQDAVEQSPLLINLANLFVNPYNVVWMDGNLNCCQEDLQDIRQAIGRKKNGYSKPYHAVFELKDNLSYGGGIVRFAKGTGRNRFRILLDNNTGEDFEDITDKISWAIIAPPILEEGVPISGEKVAEYRKAGIFADPRHDVNLLNYPSNGAHYHGMKELSADPDLRLKASLGQTIRIPTKDFLSDHDRLNLGSLIAGYEDLGYDHVSNPDLLDDRGKFCVVNISKPNEEIHIRFKKGVYPHVILGATRDGSLFTAIIDGISGQVGATLPEAGQRIKDLPLDVEWAVITANGGDAWGLEYGKLAVESITRSRPTPTELRKRHQTPAALFVGAPAKRNGLAAADQERPEQVTKKTVGPAVPRKARKGAPRSRSRNDGIYHIPSTVVLGLAMGVIAVGLLLLMHNYPEIAKFLLSGLSKPTGGATQLNVGLGIGEILLLTSAALGGIFVASGKAMAQGEEGAIKRRSERNKQRRKRLSTYPVDEACPYPTWARQANSAYNIFLRRCIRPGTAKDRIGTFTDLKWKFEEIKKMGFGTALLMPLLDPATFDPTKDDSPFNPLSLFGLDPRHIDVGEIRRFKGTTLEEKFFHMSTQPNRKPRDYDYAVSQVHVREYADVRALRALRDCHPRYKDFIITNDREYNQSLCLRSSNEDIRKLPIYKKLFELALFEQYWARKQLTGAIDFAHKIGLFVAHDVPAFRSAVGSDTVSHPEILVHDANGNLQNAGWRIGTSQEQRWEALAETNWAYLKSVGYQPLLEIFRYWTEEIGIDGFRGDAWHFSYGGDAWGYWDKVAEYCRENNILFIAETLGAQNADLTDSKNMALGNLNIASPFIDTSDSSQQYEAPQRLADYLLYATESNVSVYFATHHDSHRIPVQYGASFGWTDNHKVIATAMHAFYAMASNMWSVFQDDERVSSWRVNEPGSACTWPGGHDSGAQLDITGLFARLTDIRRRNPWLMDRGTFSLCQVSHSINEPPISYNEAGVVPFVRRSKDGKKAILTIVNLSNSEQGGIVAANLGDLGVDFTRAFTLRDSYTGENVNFKLGQNVHSDGSIYYKLAPGQSHIFEIDINPDNLSAEKQLYFKLYRSLEKFIFYDTSGKPGIYAGFPNFYNEWGRDTMIALSGLISSGRFDLARPILLKWAGLVDTKRSDGGIIPNVSAFEQDQGGNWTTSDAALWFVEMVSEYVSASGDAAFLKARPREHANVRDVLRNIIDRYKLTPGQLGENGIENAWVVHMDESTGLVFSPAQATWMDTEYTPRQGYPVEIQALWYNALLKMSKMDNRRSKTYERLAGRVKRSFNALFWNDRDNCLYDVLGLENPASPEDAVRDAAVRSNQVFAVYFGLVDGENAKRTLASIKSNLLIPAALRSLAPGTELPFASYRPYYHTDADREIRDHSYHNGTGWVWPYAYYWVSAVRHGTVSAGEARAQMVHDYNRFVTWQEFPFNQESLPELVDGGLPENNGTDCGPKGCDQQAWSVSTAMWGLNEVSNRIENQKRVSLATSSVGATVASGILGLLFYIGNALSAHWESISRVGIVAPDSLVADQTPAINVNEISGLPVIWAASSKKQGNLRVAAVQIKEGIFSKDTERMVDIVSDAKRSLGSDAPDLILFSEMLDETGNNESVSKQRTEQLSKVVSETGIAVGYCMFRDHYGGVFYYIVRPGDAGTSEVIEFNKGLNGSHGGTYEDRVISINGYKIGILICYESSAVADNIDSAKRLTANIRDAEPDLIAIPSSIVSDGGVRSARKNKHNFGIPVLFINSIKSILQDGGSRIIDSDNLEEEIKLGNEEAILITDVKKRTQLLRPILLPVTHNRNQVAAPCFSLKAFLRGLMPFTFILSLTYALINSSSNPYFEQINFHAIVSFFVSNMSEAANDAVWLDAGMGPWMTILAVVLAGAVTWIMNRNSSENASNNMHGLLPAAVARGAELHKERHPDQPEEMILERITAQNEIAEPYLACVQDRLRTHYPVLVEMFNEIYPDVLPYYILGMDINYIQHHAVVMDFASEIAVAKGYSEQEAAVLFLAALFHDAGNGLTTLPKITPRQIENASEDERDQLIAESVAFRREHMEIASNIAGDMLKSYQERFPGILSLENIEEIRRLVSHHDDLKIPLWQKDVDSQWLVARDDHLLQSLVEADTLWMLTLSGIQADIDKSDTAAHSPAEQLAFNIDLFRQWEQLYERALGEEVAGAFNFKGETLLRNQAAYLIYQRLIKKFEETQTGQPKFSKVNMGNHEKLLISLTPEGAGTFEEQVGSIMNQLDRVLGENGYTRASIVKQIAFLQNLSDRRDCEKAFSRYYSKSPPATSYIMQPPADGTLVNVELMAVKGEGLKAVRVNENITIVEDGATRWAYVAGIEPDSGIEDSYLQAVNVLEKTRNILRENGFDFKDAVRFWNYIYDIVGKDEKGAQRYSNFNSARRKVFEAAGLVGQKHRKLILPAATGIGISGGSFVIECLAVSNKEGPIERVMLTNPKQRDAFAYRGRVLVADKKDEKKEPLFSRGMYILWNILISGTASIIGEDTKHKRNVKRQTKLSIKNVLRVAKQAKANKKSVKQLKIYIARHDGANDEERGEPLTDDEWNKAKEIVERIVRKRFPSIPCLFLEADICRANLLVEIEALAYLDIEENLPSISLIAAARWAVASTLILSVMSIFLYSLYSSKSSLISEANAGIIGLALIALLISEIMLHNKASAEDSSEVPEKVDELTGKIQDTIKEADYPYPVWLFGSSAKFGLRKSDDVDIAIPMDSPARTPWLSFTKTLAHNLRERPQLPHGKDIHALDYSYLGSLGADTRPGREKRAEEIVLYRITRDGTRRYTNDSVMRAQLARDNSQFNKESRPKKTTGETGAGPAFVSGTTASSFPARRPSDSGLTPDSEKPKDLGAGGVGEETNLKAEILECIYHHNGAAKYEDIRTWLIQHDELGIDIAIGEMTSHGTIERNEDLAYTTNLKGQSNPYSPKDYHGPVIVVGASSGGWTALEEFIKKLPNEHPPIVISEHVLSETVSTGRKFVSFTGRSGRNIVICKEPEGTRPSEFYLERNIILIGQSLDIDRDARHYPVVRLNSIKLMSLAGVREPLFGAVDRLFDSASRHFRSNVVGVVLSGYGCDGSEGAESIHENRGRILAQKIEPNDSAYIAGMPYSLKSVLVTRVPIEEMAETVMGVVREIEKKSAKKAGTEPASASGITPSSFPARSPLDSGLTPDSKKPKDLGAGGVGETIASQEPNAELIKAFDRLDDAVLAERTSELYSQQSALSKSWQGVAKQRNISKLRLCVPWQVIRESADITLSLRKLGIRPLTVDRSIDFELTITGVPEEDIRMVNGLIDNRVNIREALKLPGNLIISMIEENDITKRVDQRSAHYLGIPQAVLRTDAIRGLAVGDGKLPDGEYVAIATDALSDNEARQAKEWLKDTLCPEDKTSIWVLAKPEDGKSIFSLSQLINRWLDELNKDEAERILIDIIWPLKTPAEMIEELNKFREAAWELLSKA